MANFSTAWTFTAQNEGSDSSYEQYTKWGITKPFLADWKLAPATDAYIQTITKAKAGEFVNKIIGTKLLRGSLIHNQHIFNMLLDCGFNKPKFVIIFTGQALDRSQAEIDKVIDSFSFPDSWIQAINSGNAKTFYDRFWKRWWTWIHSGGWFVKGAAGLAKRVWRYRKYGEIGAFGDEQGAVEAYLDSTLPKVKQALASYVQKKRLPIRRTAVQSKPRSAGGGIWLFSAAVGAPFVYRWLKKQWR